MPKFDYILMNPPYKKTLHLDFLERSLSMLNITGQLVIIEPAAWLNHLQDNRTGKEYTRLRQKVDGIVKSIEMANFNLHFGIAGTDVLAITHIDKSKNTKEIVFDCFGEIKTVQSIHDCNFIGERSKVKRILKPLEDLRVDETKTMKQFFKKSEDIDKLTYTPRAGAAFVEVGQSLLTNVGSWHDMTKDKEWCAAAGGMQFPSRHGASFGGKWGNFGIEMSDSVTDTFTYNEKGTKIKSCYVFDKFDTYDENKTALDNYLETCYNSKYLMFMNLCFVIGQHNVIQSYLPLLDYEKKSYTDAELYKMFGISKADQQFIEDTLKRWQRGTPLSNAYWDCKKEIE